MNGEEACRDEIGVIGISRKHVAVDDCPLLRII